MPLVPELYVSDIKKSLDFYVNTLGFVINWQRPENAFAALSREDCSLMLEEYVSTEKASLDEIKAGHWRMANFEYPLGRGISLELTLTDIDSVYKTLKEQGYPLNLEMYETQYRVNDGMISVKQFLLMDPDGYLLRFAQQLN